MAMNLLGLGLSDADHHEAALSVKEAELSLLRRVGASEDDILGVQGNLANTYDMLGRNEEALHLRQDVYSRSSELFGEESRDTFGAALNYADSLNDLGRFKEVKSLLRKATPVARRVLGEGNRLTLKMRSLYAHSLYYDAAATLDDLREAVTTFEETKQAARRVFGGSHPLTATIEDDLRCARAALRARETPPRSA